MIMNFYLANKYPIVDMNLFHNRIISSSTAVTIEAAPWVPRLSPHAKKLNHFKNSLETLRKSSYDWTLSINFKWRSALAPTLDITLCGDEVLDLVHGLLHGGGDEKTLEITVILELRYQSNDGEDGQSEIKSVKIEQVLEMVINQNLQSRNYEKRNIKFPRELLNIDSGWNRENKILSHSVSVCVNIMDYAHINNFQHQATDVNRKLLSDAIFSDFEIIAADGTGFPCHKMFLSAQSDVLSAMLHGEFKEALTNRMNMEMSARGVKSLLEFLYTGETSGAVKDCRVALELFLAADKYNISPLEQTVSDIFCGKGPPWYDIDTALKLYQFLMHYQGNSKGKLINKALEIMAGRCRELEGKLNGEETLNVEILKDMFLHSVKNFGQRLSIRNE